MSVHDISRRDLLVRGSRSAIALAALSGSGMAVSRAAAAEAQGDSKKGAQRLSLERLKKWEALGYGMFIHYGMSTYDGNELSDGKAPATLYAPDKLDVDQWISVARDAGMKYAVLTAKHVAGHCLWPTKHTNYSVVNSTDKTDVVEKFVKACEKHGLMAGFYYCSWDNHNRFGSRTPSDDAKGWGNWAGIPKEGAPMPPFTTSVYHNFQTLQLTELLTQYGKIGETWIDIPGVLGRGYREWLYNYIAKLQPETVIMMNNGIGDAAEYPVDYAWPADVMALERGLPPGGGHKRWRTIEGKEYCIPGEVCDPIGKDWFWVAADKLRADEALAKQFESCRAGGVNLLLDVPPDKHGVIPEETVKALMRLRKNAGI